MTGLPEGWRRLSLEQISSGGMFCDGDWVESKDQDPTGSVRLTQLADVGVGNFRDRSSRRLREDQAAALRCTFLQPGDILIARMPDPIGRACMVPESIGRAVTAVDVAILRIENPEIEPRYVMWAINSPEFHAAVVALQSGTTRKRISRKNLAGLFIAVPSLQEQRRIVSRIEDLLSRLDAALESIDDAEGRLDLLVQRTLRSALRSGGAQISSFTDIFAPAPPPARTVAQRDYLQAGKYPVVDQGQADIGGFTDDESAVYRGPLPVLLFGDHTRRVKYLEEPFAVGAQGVKLLRPLDGVSAEYAYWLLRGTYLPSRGYGRHYAMLRKAEFWMAEAACQDLVVCRMTELEQDAIELARSIERARARSELLRRAVLREGSSGRQFADLKSNQMVEEIVLV